MKRILLIASIILFTGFSGFAQQDDDAANKIREKMTEYLQKRLRLSNAEADKFSPVFLRYFMEARNAQRSFQNDPLIRQQKIIELRLRYRDEFRDIMGEKRGNDVFTFEREFVEKVKEIRNERLQNKPDQNLRPKRNQ
jgi:hypothetical protein